MSPSRWWDMFTSIPWMDQFAIKLVTYCPGNVRYCTVFLYLPSCFGVQINIRIIYAFFETTTAT